MYNMPDRLLQYLGEYVFVPIKETGKTLFLGLLWLFMVLPGSGQERKALEGKVLDGNTGDALVGAAVSDSISGRGTVSGTGGTFKLMLGGTQSRISVSYLGYQKLDTVLALTGPVHIEFKLYRDTIEYEQVTITSESGRDNVQSVRMGEIQLKQEDFIRLPALLGETNPLAYLQLTPGVQSTTEGGIGFYVRGGGVDQNLVLYDQAVVYNPGHLLGFVSVFNPDLVRKVSLIKSGIPARYGGRLSSVVLLDPDRGISDSLRIRGQVGLISSRISVSRSILKGRGSFVVSARRASIDLVVKPLILPFIEEANPYFNESDYRFYDFNGGLTVKFGDKDHLHFSGYYGNDLYEMNRGSIDAQSDMTWGNTVAAGKWIHIFSDRMSLSTSVTHSRYDFGFAGHQSEYAFSLASSIRDYKLSTQLERFSDKHKLAMGFDLTHHTFSPNDIDVKASGFTLAFLEFSRLYAYEGGVYFDDEYVLSDRISLAMGLRYSFFSQVGPYKEYIIDEVTMEKDSVLYPDGQTIAFYHQPEPRISVKIGVGKSASIKASYMHMAQYVHLATSSSVSLPTDFWFPSSRTVRPQTGDQVSIGYFRDWGGGQYETSLEVYYKSSRNQVEFIRGVVNNSLHMTLEENMAVGGGRSYGTDLFIRKISGRLTGWIGYTLARTEKEFERINQGKIYPAKYDRRHDLSVAVLYEINKRWNASAVFIFASGNAFTLPVARYIIQGNLINEYGEINNFRMPPYHRLDLSVSRTRVTPRGNLSSLNFSIYNVYNHANPFYFYFETSGNLEEYRLDVEPKMVSLFPIIPSLSWRFEF